jgi:iron complex transport system ATP-binding protein
MSAPVLEIDRVSVALARRMVLKDVSLSAAAGELIAVVGPNGSGKTTLLRAAAGLVPFEGKIALNGRALGDMRLNERARTVAYLPQGSVFHWPLSVAEVVGLGRLPMTRGAGLSDGDRAAVHAAMERTETLSFAARPVTTLSGGERSRVAMARVLATGAPLILADEATAALDLRHQIAVLDLLRRHTRSGGTVVAVLHDLGLAARTADRIVVLDAGRVVADAPPRDALTSARLAETFGVDADVVDEHGTLWVKPRGLSGTG